MKIKNISPFIVTLVLATSALAMEDNSNNALLDPRDMAKSVSQILSVSGRLSAAQVETVQNALTVHFNPDDRVVAAYMQERKEALVYLAEIAGQRSELCEGLQDQDGIIANCLQRQGELTQELAQLAQTLEQARSDLNACNTKFGQECKVLDDKLQAAGASLLATILRLKTSFFENRVCRGIVAGGRLAVPGALGASSVAVVFQTCSESALQCVRSSPYQGLLGCSTTLGSYVVLHMLHKAGQEVAALAKQKEELEKKHVEEEAALEARQKKLEKDQSDKNQEQIDQLETNKRADSRRRELESNRQELDKRVANAVETCLDDAIYREIQELAEAAEDDQTDNRVHKRAVTRLQNILDLSIVKVANKVSAGETVLLLCGTSTDQKSSTIEMLDDDK